MHSISNLLKLNEINNQKLDFETMSLENLKIQQKKFQNLKNNTKLMKTLKDNGEKITNTLKRIEVIIQKISEKEAAECTVEGTKQEEKKEKESSPKNEVETLLDKLESLAVEKTEIKIENETKENSDKDQKEICNQVKIEKVSQNYFARISSKTEKKVKTEIDQVKLSEIKQKILTNMNNRQKYKQSKEIPVDECFKLLKEHEKKIQEFQMKQAAERLLQGQSVKYDFSFMDKTDNENLKYRDTKETDFDDHFLDDDEDDEDDDFYDHDELYSETGIDKVHKTEVNRNKYKQLNDDLEKID